MSESGGATVPIPHHHSQVIKNGQMLGIHERPNGKNVSSGSMASLVGEVDLINFYNDGGMGTGTSKVGGPTQPL